MKRLLMLIPMALTFATLTLNCTTPQPSQSPEEAIWELEEAYCNNHRDAIHAAILTAYHEDFLGWPQTSPSPERKVDMPEYLQQNFPEPSDDILEFDEAEIEVSKLNNHMIFDAIYETYQFTSGFKKAEYRSTSRVGR